MTGTASASGTPARAATAGWARFERLQDAKRAEADAIARPAFGGSLTVAEWAREWQDAYARGAVSTRRTYRYAWQKIVDSIGSEKLAEVTRPEAKRLANAWSRNTTRVARTMWADALRDGLCQHNPFTNLRLETPNGRKDITALTEPEIAQLAQVAGEQHGDYGEEAAALVLFAAYTGVRPGELAALRWCDLDIPNRRATVSRALDGQGGIKAPKNGKPRRIVLPPPALRALTMVPRPLDQEDTIFHTPRGKRLTKGTLAYLWRPIVAAWRARGGRDLDLHELRHACATLLLERGLAPADVAVQLGHTDGGRLVGPSTGTRMRTGRGTGLTSRLPLTAITPRWPPNDSATTRPPAEMRLPDVVCEFRGFRSRRLHWSQRVRRSQTFAPLQAFCAATLRGVLPERGDMP